MANIIKNNRVNYYNKDFTRIREDLINYAKTYFPNSGNDFSPASPGMMFIEMASYVGDLLSFYLDKQIQETFIETATERENIIQLANMLGYTHKNITPASVTLSVFQLVPNVFTNGTASANLDYALKIKEGSVIGTNDGSGISFRLLQDVNMAVTGTEKPTIYETSNGVPTYWLLKNYIRASAGSLKEDTFYFPANSEPNPSIKLNELDVIEIDSVTDSNGNTWYEVPYLAQQTILESTKNDNNATNDLYVYENDTPYLLNYVVTNKKFIRRINANNTTELIFGSGVAANTDNVLFPNQENINQGFETTDINNRNLDPTNFIYLQANGEVPRDTTLTVKYYTGGGLKSNVAQATLTEIQTLVFGEISQVGLIPSILQFCKNSITFTNESAAQGGRGEETDDEIKQNAIAFFGAQNRCVTAQDYMIRALSLPQKFGNVAKVFAKRDDQIGIDGTKISNPLAINLYCLAYDASKNFVLLNDATKINLVKYLDFYRMATDAVNIKNAYIINIGIKFSIVSLKNYNQNEVLLKCIMQLKKTFDNDNMQINKPIIISEIYNLLSLVDGVQSVKTVDIVNKYGGNYSMNKYDVASATKNGILYPAMDASVFEIKFPDADLEGKVVNY